jgi:hypothetical protein
VQRDYDVERIALTSMLAWYAMAPYGQPQSLQRERSSWLAVRKGNNIAVAPTTNIMFAVAPIAKA